jgi:hypothetical protein
MTTPLKTQTLIPSKAPNLPIGPTEYNQQYQDQLNNILRLYFASLDNFTQAIIVPSSGITADRPIENLQIGQYYFDTTIGRPIWWNGTNWINASGTVV